MIFLTLGPDSLKMLKGCFLMVLGIQLSYSNALDFVRGCLKFAIYCQK